MKSSIMAVLQQRMDKCTTEQNWIVALLLAINGVITAKPNLIPDRIPHVAALSVTLALSLYVVLYCLERHCSYYRNRMALSKLLEEEPDSPDFLRECPKLWTFRTAMGIAVQIVLIMGSWIVSMIALLT